MKVGPQSIFPADVRLFATCPQSRDEHAGDYRARVTEIARWSERTGCEGILVYTDNGLVDPWLVAQLVIEATERLSPLVAVQPIYMHPYAVAKLVASLGHLYGRRVYLNMVAGGFRNDLLSLGDETAHDDRYDRVVEYARVVMELLAGGRVSFEGTYYNLRKVTLTPSLSPQLMPGVFVSGSSDAGLHAARVLGATAVKYPKPPTEEADLRLNGAPVGMRVGIVTREGEDEAWRVARARFPMDRRGRVAHGLAMKVSDSQWHRQLSELGATEPSQRNPYWLGPFENYKTFCPYLVGSYDRVAEELARYLGLGFRTFILDIPASEDELSHTAVAFERALGRVEAS